MVGRISSSGTEAMHVHYHQVRDGDLVLPGPREAPAGCRDARQHAASSAPASAERFYRAPAAYAACLSASSVGRVKEP
jgi:hypothetical protein